MLLRKGLKNEKHTHHSKVYYGLKSQWGRRKMAFELIYLYIDDIGRNIKQCGIPFSNMTGTRKIFLLKRRIPELDFSMGKTFRI